MCTCTVSSEQLTFQKENPLFVCLTYNELSSTYVRTQSGANVLCEVATSGLSGHLQIQNLSGLNSVTFLFFSPCRPQLRRLGLM